MTEREHLPRVAVGAVMGAIVGVVFGGITAVGATHGDSTIRSGLSPGRIFVLSFVGWTLGAIVIARLWVYARSERSANWVGIVSAMPMVLTSLIIASPRWEFFSVIDVVSFVLGDVIVGIVIGELGWKHFGPLPSKHDGDVR